MSNFPIRANFFYLNKQLQSWRSSFAEIRKQENFSTHLAEDKNAEKIHALAQDLFLVPWNCALRSLAYVVQPLPGKGKENYYTGVALRVANLALLIVIFPVALAGAGLGIIPHMYGHLHRPFLSVIDCAEERIALPEKRELDMRTYNLGLTYEASSIIGDLRPCIQRVDEVARHILAEVNPPDVICFQEVFSIEATRHLCNQLKRRYTIIHSVAPHGLGLCSGQIIMSRLPIEEVSFRRFTNMIGPEKLSPRGLLGVRVRVDENHCANIYNTHLQAIYGKKRAEIRSQQLAQIVEWIDEDDSSDRTRRDGRIKVGDFFMGDLNFSRIDKGGYFNTMEEETLNFLSEHFEDPFCTEHDALSGERIRGNPRFLDRERMPQAEEPSASCYHGPAANEKVYRIKKWAETVGKRGSISIGRRIKNVGSRELWGTAAWADGPRKAHLERYDYQLRRKRPDALAVEGIAEIEHIHTDKESAPSDHLPLRAVYSW